MPAPEHLSHSQLETLRQCGEQYRLRYIADVERQPSTAAVGGTVVHAATEIVDQQLLQGVSDAPTLMDAASAEAELVFEKQLAEIAEKSPNFVDPATWLSYGQHGYQNLAWYRKVVIPAAIKNFIAWREATPYFTPVDMPDFGPAIEWPFEVDFLGRRVRGVIDRIYQDTNSGACAVVDIKSGVKPKHTAQLGMYGYALRAMYPDGNWRWGTFVYNLKYPEGSKYTTATTAPIDLNWWSDARLARYHAPAVQALDNQIFIASPGEACFHCCLKHGCEFADAAL